MTPVQEDELWERGCTYVLTYAGFRYTYVHKCKILVYAIEMSTIRTFTCPPFYHSSPSKEG